MKAVIVSAARTPIGKFLGGLKDVPAPELGATAIREALRRAGLSADKVEDVVMGQVIQAGSGQNPARQAALKAGIPSGAGATTVNMVCGSGLKAVISAAQSVLLGDAGIVAAGGMESMSRAPHYLMGSREGLRLGPAELKDANIQDGLWCALTDQHMGMTAELVAREYGVTRAEQDAFALESHRRALAAMDAGLFEKEIVPVEVSTRKGTVTISSDESPRRDTSLEALAKLKPAFVGDGSVTAGNAPGLNDAAAALVITSDERARAEGLKPLAVIEGYATAGLDPQWVMMTPVPATRKLLEKLGASAADFDLFEFNEAFSVQGIAVMRDLGIDPERANVHGGAVALGHPIGASGARILVTLLHALEARGLERGLASLCMGGANGLALAIRRV
jgi:acetyl-CoA C-acetyltransferase